MVYHQGGIMSDFTTQQNFKIQKPVNRILLKKIAAQIENIQGVDSTCISDDSICVDYYPQLLDNHILINLIEDVGLLIDKSTPENLRGISKFLKKLELSNKKSFGTEQLDCCKLNQKNK